jgi:Mn-dependent DtxR family transcriptional regulator
MQKNSFHSYPSFNAEELLTQIKCIVHNKFMEVQYRLGGKSWPWAARFAMETGVKAKQSTERTAAPARSVSTEDHLERIQELVDRKGYARVTDIADSLGLSKSAVSNMVRRLAARGFVNYEKYRGFTLTPQGQAVASHIKVRHKTLTELLELLGLSPATVAEEVEAIEHHLKPETLRVLTKLVRFWRTHPGHLQAFRQHGKTK